MRFDIRSQIVLLLMMATCASLNTNIYIETGLILIVSLLQRACGKGVFMPKLLLIYFLFLVIQYVLFPVLPETVVMLLSMLVINVRSFFPVLMSIALIYKTTKVSQMTAALSKMHIPKNAVITVAIAIRYIPSLGEEWRHIRDAMRVRQVTAHIHNPFSRLAKKFECYLVPLFLSAIKTADELSAAAVTRGIENPGEFTCRSYRQMGIADYMLIWGSVAAMAGCAILRYAI